MLALGNLTKPFQTNLFTKLLTSTQAQNQKWETLLKGFEANSTQCSQAVTHPSTVWVSMNCQASLSPEGRSPEGERLPWQFMETLIVR
jgi:hypothetical protein